jgi:hypothetical protein
MTTDTVVLRGRFQTLPIALYGWSLTPEQPADPGAAGATGLVLRPLDADGGPGCPGWGIPGWRDPAGAPGAGEQFAQELPDWARAALEPLLAAWVRCGASERRMRAHALSDDALAGVLAAADRASEARSSPTQHTARCFLKLQSLRLPAQRARTYTLPCDGRHGCHYRIAYVLPYSRGSSAANS